MKYEPAPGSLASRALAHMSLLVPGSEISNPTLASALGLGTSSELIKALRPAVEAGAIFGRQKGGHIRSPLFWSLVDHSTESMAAPPPGPQTPLANPARGIDAGAAHRPRDRPLNPNATAPVVTAQMLDPLGWRGSRDLGPSTPDAAAPGPESQRLAPGLTISPTGKDLFATPTHCKHDNPVGGLNYCRLCDDEENTEGRDSQQVLKAEPATADATDREIPADASPSVGSMGAGQPSDEGAEGDFGAVTANPALTWKPMSAVEMESIWKERGHRPGTEVKPEPIRFAVWDDGEFNIVRNGAREVYTRAEFRRLLDFLDSISLDFVREDEPA